MVLKFLQDAQEQERGYLMLPENFDFAMLPPDFKEGTLEDIGMLGSSIESIDYAITSWLKEYATNGKTNGFVVGVSGGIDSALTSTLCAKTGLPTLCVEIFAKYDILSPNTLRTFFVLVSRYAPKPI